MQQKGSQYGVPPEMTPFSAATATPAPSQMLGGTEQNQQQQAVSEAEAASPISSRPPAHSSAGNFDELLPVPCGLPDEDGLAAGDEIDRGGISGGNRWPRQETLALLKIRSEMDVAFRDATLKGPLWEEVSRKLAELGYSRSAKKCKEKFENVHKYYKRTKEGRAGRQDGKSYRFFSQLEALYKTTATATASISNFSAVTATAMAPTSTTANTTNTTNIVDVAPVPIGIGISNPMPAPHLISATPSNMGASPIFPAATGSATAVATTPLGISFSSDSSSSTSSGSDGDEEVEGDEDDLEFGEPSNTDSSRGRKRKRESSRGARNSSRRMMEFFEGLMKQVMQKQETMQQRFLETIEKREQDRMIREEAWKRQEMARLAREHELMAQERAISASRDAAIIAFLQKITGQTIQLPPSVTIPAAPPPPPAAVPQPPPPSPRPPPPQQQQQLHFQQQQQQQHHHHHHRQTQSAEVMKHQQPVSTEVVVAVPEQQVAPQEMDGGGSFDPTSSRWPKAEVLALIKLRSGLEARYQEAGPKGPLWEEISAGMQRMGYRRNAKRCKEKWENINKYFKKVKESNKKRPEDAKTCPYFHQLDALYRKKILGSGSSSSSSFGNQNRPEQQQQKQQQQQEISLTLDPIPTTKVQDRMEVPVIMLAPQTVQATDQSENKNGDRMDVQASNGGLAANLFGEGSSSGGGETNKPEGIVKEIMGQGQQMMDDYDKMEEADSDNLEQEEDEDEDGESDDDQKLGGYKIEFQRQNAGSLNRGEKGAPSSVAMVQ